MPKITCWGVSLGLLLGGAGCRHAAPVERGTSSFVMVERPAEPPPKAAKAEAAEPTSSSQYREAQLKGDPVLPVYPPRALEARAGAATVGMHVTVDTEGRVADIRPSLLAPSFLPAGFAEDFREAVEVALRQWRFTPARVEYIEIVTTGDFSYSRVKGREPLEAEFDLAFSFLPTGKVETGKTGK